MLFLSIHQLFLLLGKGLKVQGNHPVQDTEEIEVVYVEPVEDSTTTSTTTTTKSPTVIVLQQNPYPNPYPMYSPNSYYPGYQHNQPVQYHPHMMMQNTPPTTTTSTTTTTTTTSTTVSTTKKPRRRRKKKKPKPVPKPSGQITYQNMAPNVLIDGILPFEVRRNHGCKAET